MLDQQATSGMGKVGWEGSRHQVTIYFQRLISNAWQLIVLLLMLLCCRIYKRFDFTESYCTIHSFFAPKIADATILYARKVLITFNRHLNCKREFTMITGKTLRDHFDAVYGSLTLLFTLDIMNIKFCL